MSDIKTELKELMQEEFIDASDMKEVKDDTSLISTGILDSIKTLMLVDALEKKFGIAFEAHEVDQDNLDSIDRMAAFIERKREG